MMRFTMRDLLWLIVVMALACGWFFTTRREIARHRREEDEARLYWAKAQFDANQRLTRLEAVATQWTAIEMSLRDIDARLRKIEDSPSAKLANAAESPN